MRRPAARGGRSAAARQTLPPSPILGLSPLSFSSETTTSQRCLLGSLGSLPKKTTLPAASGPAQSVVDRESLSACAPARPLVLLSPPSMHAPLYVRGVSLSLSLKKHRGKCKKNKEPCWPRDRPCLRTCADEGRAHASGGASCLYPCWAPGYKTSPSPSWVSPPCPPKSRVVELPCGLA